MRKLEVNLVGLPRAPKWRPKFVVRAGERLLPVSVTDAWYDAGCPQKLDHRAAGRVAFRVSRWLRGCR